MATNISRRVFIGLFSVLASAYAALAQDAGRRAILDGAKKEGEVVWYTSAGLQDSNPMAEAFQRD